MGGGENHQLRHLVDDLARDRIQSKDPLDLISPELNPDDRLLVRGENLQGVSPDPEFASNQVDLVPFVLDVHQPLDRRFHRVFDALYEAEQLAQVLLGRAQPVDGGDRGHDDHIVPNQQSGGCRVPKPVDLIVDRGVLLDVSVGLRDVGLRLVVVVIGDEVLHAVVGEELPELICELGAQRLVGSQDQSRLLNLFDGPGDGGRLPRPGDPQQGLITVAPVDPLGELLDGLWLVAGRGKVGDDLEVGHQRRVPTGWDKNCPR